MFLHMFALKLFDQPSMVKLDWGMNLDLQFKFCRKFEKERAVLCQNENLKLLIFSYCHTGTLYDIQVAKMWFQSSSLGTQIFQLLVSRFFCVPLHMYSSYLC